MRITNSMLAQNLLRNLETAQNGMENIQNQLSTGYRINQPSDDPVGTENAMQLQSTISSVTQWQANANSALDFMKTTSSTLDGITSMVQRVRELAVQGASDTLSASDRTAIASEVDQIAGQIQITANAQSGDQYIFAGTNNAKPPFASGQIWAGNSEPVYFQLGNNLSIDTSANGDQVFNHPTTGGEGLLSGSQSGNGGILADLSTALKSNDQSKINAALSVLDANINNITSLSSDLGARINRVNSLQQQLSNTSANLQQNLSGIRDTDMAQAITQFTQMQNTYNSSLAVGAKIIEPSLVDFLK